MIVDHDGDGDTFNPNVVTEGEGTPPWLAQKRRVGQGQTEQEEEEGREMGE